MPPFWMNLDYEVCAPVGPIFDFLDEDSDMSLNVDPGRPNIYNSGVVVFRKNGSLLVDWG